jgi:hypothetical protein
LKISPPVGLLRQRTQRSRAALALGLLSSCWLAADTAMLMRGPGIGNIESLIIQPSFVCSRAWTTRKLVFAISLCDPTMCVAGLTRWRRSDPARRLGEKLARLAHIGGRTKDRNGSGEVRACQCRPHIGTRRRPPCKIRCLALASASTPACRV